MKNEAASGNRDRANGQYVYSNDRLCTCGHTLGNHSAATVNGQRDCFGPTPGQGSCDSDCQSFKPAKAARG